MISLKTNIDKCLSRYDYLKNERQEISINYLYPMKKKEWFEEWFNTSYYHQLYQHRDGLEAAHFIHQLLGRLNLAPKAEVLDLACGKGRHAVIMQKHGLRVLGVDLSANSISDAQQHANIDLHFAVHDMRQVIPDLKFDAVFNLFTSFGYFDSIEDNKKVVEAVHYMLDDDGYFVIDFMNAIKVIKGLIAEENKTIDHVQFHIRRYVENGFIIKEIDVNDQGEIHHFQERVQALTKDDFENLLLSNGFKIISTFGDFDLNEFDPLHSDRLILIAQKR